MQKTQPYCRFVLLLALLFFSAYAVTAQIQPKPFSYDEQWDKIEQFTKDNRPESALEEVKMILKQAEKDQNTLQYIKASVRTLVYTLQIDPKKAPEQISRFEALIDQAKNEADKALLQSMTAELYQMYYDNHYSVINKRTDVLGLSSENLTEWTKNQFSDKIRTLLTASLQNPNALLQIKANTYQLLFKTDEGESQESTLFDFLAYRRIQVLLRFRKLAYQTNMNADPKTLFLPSERFIQLELDTTATTGIDIDLVKTHQQRLLFLERDGNPAALIQADLNRLQNCHELLEMERFRVNWGNARTMNTVREQYLQALISLAQRFENNENVVEVLQLAAECYRSSFIATDSIQKTYYRKAYDICTDALARFPNSQKLGMLQNIREQILQKQISIICKEVVKPHSNLSVELKSSNMDQVELNVYRVNVSAFFYHYHLNDVSNNYLTKSLVENRLIDVRKDPNFHTSTDTFLIRTGEYGIYEFTLGEKDHPKDFVKGYFVVSDFSYLTQSTSPNKIIVVDRITGKPQVNVGIKVYAQVGKQGKYQLKEYSVGGTTDENGIYEYKNIGNYQNLLFFLEKGADKFLSNQNYTSRYYGNSSEKKDMWMSLFTDRSLYRPGQLVYFKGIAYYSNSEKQEVVPNKWIDISLLDANKKQVAIKTLKTNEFGSFSDCFVLPKEGLNGRFMLRSDYSYTSIWVEEYKRPTFEVIVEQPKTEVNFGESVTMVGKATAYAGYPVGEAMVSYRVFRRSHSRWLWETGNKEVKVGTSKTASDGSFKVDFQPQRDNLLKGDQFYSYQITATITDQKGETQTGETSTSVGDKSLLLLCDLANGSKVDKKGENAFEVVVETLNGEQKESTVHYEIYRTKSTNDFAENILQKTSAVPDILRLSGTHLTNEGKLKLELNKLESGMYQLVLKTKDRKEGIVEIRRDFIVYAQNDKRPPVKTFVWNINPKTKCAIGEKAIIKFGSSAKDVHVYYQIMSADQELESKWITLSNEIRTFEIPFQSTYGDGVNVLFTFTKDEKMFTRNITLIRKAEERKLNPKLAIFRDKLQPGEQAEWTINVPEALQKERVAELLVYMYDASLDAIRNHPLRFLSMYRPTNPYCPTWSSKVATQRQNDFWSKMQEHPIVLKKYRSLDWMNLTFDENGRMEFHTAVVSERTVKGIEIADLEDHKVEVRENPIRGLDLKLLTRNEESLVDLKLNMSPKIRTNFNETAFFYPQLRTDEQGNVKIAFTVPESLTRWNIHMMAHTKDLFNGSASEQAVTQKELMVQLNLPRFVRKSDKLLLRANVVNLLNKAQSATVRLELINPENNKPIVQKDGLIVELAAKESKFVEWEVTEFAPYELVICKIVASSESFSDGEQKYLPVLPDQVLITESVPMTVRANQTRNFSFDNLVKNGSKVNTQSFTVEFSPNPAWYAVQALPSLATPENENAFDYFTAYYVNTLATMLANSNPTISAVFDQWKQSEKNRDALLSNLEKNKEFKSMILEETPWVQEAQDESEQKRRIALLFDLNQQKQQNTQYWDKLMMLQMPSGGFSWFENMSESRYVTQYILLNAARLNTMLGSEKRLDRRLERAIAYLDNELSRDYEHLRLHSDNYKTTMTIGDMHWFYLHVRSEYPEVPIPDFAKNAVAYYTEQATTYWQKATLYGKAATALIAGRNKNPELASKILVSLKENALKTEDMGMYWARNTAGFFWNQRPVMVQSMILEAFAEQSKTSADLDEMKIWLLRQKQTQRWDSPLSTVDAIYALLHTGSDWLASSNEVSIQLGDVPVRTEQKEAGTGYFKQRFDASEVTPTMVRAKVQLKGKSGFGWGAMYWQFYQNENEVQQSGNALIVSKKLFVEQLLPAGKVMTPIEKTELKVGDKIITRLVVTVDRDMEYVALKDLRAACLEPVQQRSGSVWKEGVRYYQTTKDASTQFFFSSLPKGSYVFEYEAWVNNAGTFTSGITTVQCQYAPEFCAHSGGSTMVVSEVKK